MRAAKGWRYHAEREKEILNKQGLADVWIETPRGVIACEIGITTTTDHEVGNIIKCFNAGAKHVAAIGVEAEKLRKLQEAVMQAIAPELASRVGFYLVNDFLDHLQKIGTEDARPLQAEAKIGKYKVTSSFAQLSEEERQLRLENAHRNFVAGAKKSARSKK